MDCERISDVIIDIQLDPDVEILSQLKEFLESDASLHLLTAFCVILMTIIGLVLANTWCKKK